MKKIIGLLLLGYAPWCLGQHIDHPDPMTITTCAPTILIMSPTTTAQAIDDAYRKSQWQDKLLAFILEQHQNLARDTSEGKGEYLKSATEYLAKIAGQRDQKCFFLAAQAHFNEIFPPDLKYDAPGKLSENSVEMILEGFVKVWEEIPKEQTCAAPSGDQK